MIWKNWLFHKTLFCFLVLAFTLVGCLTVKQEKPNKQEVQSQPPINYKVGKDIPIATHDVDEDEPVVAWNGTNYFVVWQYQRNGSFDIYGSRISPNGEVLDPEGLPISTAPSDQIKPKIFWNGTYHLVVWQDKRNGKNWEIYGARVGPDGKVLDPDGLPISVGIENRGTPAVSWNGENFFVVWEKEDPRPFSWNIYGARITPEGKVLDPEGIPIVKAPEDQYSSGISWNGKTYMVVWSDKRSGASFDIYGARINSDGTVQDREGFVVTQASGDQFFPSISWNGEVHLVAWMDKRMGDSASIYGDRITAQGTVLDQQGIAIATSPAFHALPVVISKGKEFLVVWDVQQKITAHDIYTSRVNPKGKVLDPDGLSIYTGNERQRNPSVATDGNRYFVVWKDERTGIPYQGDIYGQLIDFSEKPQDSPPLGKDADEPPSGPFIIHQISINPTEPNTIFAATSHYGIIRSEDRGQHWSLINKGFKSLTHHQIVVHPQNPDVLYAGAWGGGMSKSVDGGNSWQEINTHLGDTAVNSIALHPKDPNRIYIATESGVFRSTTGGMDWEPMNKGLARSYTEAFQDLILVQTDPDLLYLGSNQGLYQWDESSGKWIVLRHVPGETITTLAYNPGLRMLFAGTVSSGLFKSEDMGKNWNPVEGVGPSWVTKVVIDPVDPAIIYVSTATRGVLKTVDGGKHWEERNGGLPDTNVRSLAIDPKDPQNLYAGTYENGIFISHDGGETWVGAQSIPRLTMTEILRTIHIDQDTRFPADIKVLLDSPKLANQVFTSGVAGLVPPPEFVKCNGCHGWTDPLLNLRKGYWRVPSNIRDWKFTVKERMGSRAGLNPREEETIIQFLSRYSLATAPSLIPVTPTSLVPIPPTSSTLLPGTSERESPKQTVQRVCGQCHGLKIVGQCVAGDCQGRRVHETGGRQWAFVVDWMRSMGAKMNDQEQSIITEYLTKTYPAKPYPLNWTKSVTLPGKGWNITSLQTLGSYLYAGTEGSGKIFRSSDGKEWKEVKDTNEYRVYGISKFKGLYFAASDTPRAELWNSTDGENWERISTLPDHQSGIISMGSFKGSLYAGTAEGRVYRSPDGKTWELAAILKELDEPHWVRFIMEFKGMLYVGTDRGYLYRSPDGSHWEEIGQVIRKNRDPYGIRAAAVFKGRLYVGSITHGEIWRTEDGEKWSLCFDVTPGKDMGYIASMTVYAGVLYTGITTHSGFVFRTSDGEKWEEVGNLSPHTIEAMAVFKGQLYAGTLIPPEANIYRASLRKK